MRPRVRRILVPAAVAAVGLTALLIAAVPGGRGMLPLSRVHLPGVAPERVRLNEHPRAAADRIVNGAKLEVLRGVSYDAGYQVLTYPGGDVAQDRGACTDLVVRALRSAGYDLQQLIHEDIRRNFSRYPGRYGLSRPDPSIDHRRTPNQIAFFERHGLALPARLTGRDTATWQPGDLVYCRLPGGMGHCGVLSDVRNSRGLPLVLHNCGRAAQEDVLEEWDIRKHFRFPPPRSSEGDAQRPG